MTITYLVKQGKGNEAHLIGTNDASKATHFEKDGKQFPISKLTQSDMQQGPSGNEAEETPLPLTGEVTNEGKKKSVGNDVLDLPKLDFSVSHTEDQQESETHEVKAEESEAPLDVPKW